MSQFSDLKANQYFGPKASALTSRTVLCWQISRIGIQDTKILGQLTKLIEVTNQIVKEHSVLTEKQQAPILLQAKNAR